MKIQDIKVDVFEWKGTPWKTNYRNIFGQDVNLSVIRIITDEGIEEILFWDLQNLVQNIIIKE